MSKEQISAAKAWDLLSYLRTFEPQELVQSGPNEYSTRSHDSLKISHGKWCWNSRGIGGRTALDYLIRVRGMGFIEAVEILCRHSAPYEIQALPHKEKRLFVPPEASISLSSVVPYLHRRGIDSEIISACLNAEILYESRKYHNCVFLGKDPSGCARFACLRGTWDNFKQDAPGSDKRFGFCLPARDAECPRLAVAESPIDAMSLATLVKRYGGDWLDSSYLSLGGTASLALLQYLRDHPQITQVSLCLDNDKAGMDGMDRLKLAVREDPKLSKRIRLMCRNPPPKEWGKDYNEFLVKQAAMENAVKPVVDRTTR